MLTTDLALRFDPAYEKISRRFLEHPDEFADAFAKAWYKLLHRDMGPVSRYLGPWVPEAQLWQDPVPAVDHELVDADDVAALKEQILGSGLSVAQLVVGRVGLGVDASAAPTSAAAPTARASASRRRRTGRSTSRRSSPKVLHGAGADPAGLQQAQTGGKKVSLADLIVLGGCAAVEKAARDAGVDVTVPFSPGPHRRVAGADRRRRRSRVLEPRADGFRNYLRAGREAAAGDAAARPGQPADADRAGDDGAGRRHAGARRERRRHEARRLHRPAGHVDQRLLRQPARHGHGVEGVERRRERLRGPRPRDRRGAGGRPPRSTSCSARTRSCGPSPRSTRSDDAQEKFVRDFVAAWAKVMDLDRFDLR